MRRADPCERAARAKVYVAKLDHPPPRVCDSMSNDQVCEFGSYTKVSLNAASAYGNWMTRIAPSRFPLATTRALTAPKRFSQ
jgi:hypothetical protein